MPTHPIIIVDDEKNTAENARGFVPDAVARTRRILRRYVAQGGDFTIFIRIAKVENEKGEEAQAPESPTPKNTPPVNETADGDAPIPASDAESDGTAEPAA